MKKLHNSIIALEIFLITMSLVVIGVANKTLTLESALALVPELPSHTFITSTHLNQFASVQSMVQGLVINQPIASNISKTEQPVVQQVAMAPETGNTEDSQNINLSYSHVVIPSVQIDAPITWDVDGRDMDKYLPVLRDHIAHYDWTPKPGEGGSTMLFAHSTFWENLPNNFDEVFAPLYDMKNGDKVYVVYAGKLFTYEMYQSKVIVPTDPEFISQDGPERVMLMTCYPLGSTKNRLLVYAKRVQ